MYYQQCIGFISRLLSSSSHKIKENIFPQNRFRHIAHSLTVAAKLIFFTVSIKRVSEQQPQEFSTHLAAPRVPYRP